MSSFLLHDLQLQHPLTRLALSGRVVRLIVVSLAWSALWFASSVLAQDNSPIIGPLPLAQDEIQGPAGVRISELDTYYLPNEDGELIAVFQFPFEEFERMLREQQEEAPEPNVEGVSFQILESDFSGQVNSQLEQARLRLKIRIRPTESGEISVPLGLSNWALAGPVQSEVTGFRLSRKDDQSLQLAFPGIADSVLEFVLPLRARVQSQGQTSRLDVPYPHTTLTTFELTIDQENLEAEGRRVVGMKTGAGDTTTTLSVAELSGESSFSWRKVNEESQRFRTKAQLTTNGSLEALSLRRWNASTTLRLKPLGQPITELLVAAPSESRDFAVIQAGVDLDVITWQEAKEHTAFISDSLKGRTFLLLKFLREVREEYDVTLTCLLDAPEPKSTNAPAELVYDGFHIFDCVFVSGTLALTNTQRELDTSHVASTGITLNPTVPGPKEVRQFELSRQDYRLTLTTRRRPAQVSLAPEYTLVLNSEIQVAMLTVRYKGTLQGQFSDSIRIPMKNWNNEREELTIEDGNLILNPTTQMDLNTRPMSWVASQSIGKDEVDLELPVPITSGSVLLEPATLLVVTTPSNREFLLDKSASGFEETSRENSYRSKTGTDVLRLKGTVSLKPRVVDFSHRVDLELKERETLVEGEASKREPELAVSQQLGFDIQNQELPELWFLLREASTNAQMRLNGRPITTRMIDIRVAGENWVAVEPVLGNQKLLGSLSFEWNDFLNATTAGEATQGSEPVAVPEQVSDWTFPLAQPIMVPVDLVEACASAAELDQLIRQQVETFSIRERAISTSSKPGYQYELDQRWVLGGVGAEGNQSWTAYGKWPSTAALRIRDLSQSSAMVIVEKAALQTWWEQERRLDRWVILLKTDKKDVQVTLPGNARLEQLLIGDQVVSSPTTLEDGRIQINLADNPKPTEGVLLELWLERSVSANWWYNASVDPPLLSDDLWCRDFRWQLFLNGNWQCLSWANIFSRDESVFGQVRNMAVGLETNGVDGFEERLQNNGSVSVQPGLMLMSSQIPKLESLLLVNRYWLRMTIIAAIFMAVLIVWWTRVYRQFYFWLILGFTLTLFHATAPMVFGSLLPLVATSFLAAACVLILDSVSRRTPRIFAEMDTFVGSTRTVGPDSMSNHSQVDSNRTLTDSARQSGDSQREGNSPQ